MHPMADSVGKETSHMLIDAFSRHIDYLRVSVTEQCDLRCIYCRPRDLASLPLDYQLSNEEFVTVVRASARLGVRKVRLTGGEPLLHHGLVALVQDIARIPGISDLALTTNGLHLAEMAQALAAAGLRRVNVSLDTLRPERFVQITGAPGLERVLRGIEAARRTDLVPVKVNTVVMRGINDDELETFASLTVWEDWHVRFIELMPFGGLGPDLLVRTSEMQARLPGLVPVPEMAGRGPGRVFRLPGAQGTVGFISPVSDCFCYSCNRLRLTADGKLRPCLLSEGEVDLRPALRNGAPPEELTRLILQAVASKPQQHRLADGVTPTGRCMSQIGG